MKNWEKGITTPAPKEPEDDSREEEIIENLVGNVVRLDDYRETQITPEDRKRTVVKPKSQEGYEVEAGGAVPRGYDVNFMEVDRNLQEATELPPAEFIAFVNRLQLDERYDPWLGLGNQSDAVKKYFDHPTQENLEAISTTSDLRKYALKVIST